MPDYDGTLSEIATRPSTARPVAHARRILRALAAHPERVAVAIISGRDLATLRAMLRREREVWMAGSHGIEIIDPRGRRHSPRLSVKARAEIAKLRVWMKRQVPHSSGFVVEDKRATMALTIATRNRRWQPQCVQPCASLSDRMPERHDSAREDGR